MSVQGTRRAAAARRRKIIGGAAVAAVIVIAVVVVVLVSGGSKKHPASGSPSAANGAPPSGVVNGGKVVEAIIGVPPNYVFPMEPPADSSGENLDFETLQYLPLYVLGNSGGIELKQGLAQPPTYSDSNQTVTIHLRNVKWSDGTPVTSRDVEMFINLAKFNKDSWSGYTPGDFPDNLKSFATPNASTIVLHLTGSVNPTWFTDNQLSGFVAFPQHAWDKTSPSGKIGNYDRTPAGAKAVYKFLSKQSADLQTYATNPLWRVVDGPWEMKSFQPNTGPDVFVPNPKFSPQPHISQYVTTIYTTGSAEFNALLAGNEVDIGGLPTEDLPQLSRISNDYTLNNAPSWHIGFYNMNFKNPVTGPIVSQLYVRQALAHLEDEQGQVNAYLDHGKAGYPVYGPLPPQPPSQFIASTQKTDQYPFSIQAARSLLTAHGWKIPSSGPATCVRPGTAANECGAGIPSGQKLEFNFQYATGEAFLQSQVANFKSDAAKAGVVLNVSSAPFQTLLSTMTECVGPGSCPAKSWQIGTWNAGGYNWGYGSAYATGDWFSEVTNYSSPEFDKLFNATRTSSDGVSAMHAYDTYVTKDLPVIWAPTTYGLTVVNSKLKGVQFDASGFENTIDWYYTK